MVPVKTTQNGVPLDSSSASLTVKPLPQLGAEIVDLRLERLSDREVVAALRGALLQHKMLLVRGIELAPEQQLDLTRVFGFELHTAAHFDTGQYWHCDGHHLADPSAITVMHLGQAAAAGPTLVADLEAAYGRLPDRIKMELIRVGCRAPETGVVHSLVRNYPYTNATALYVNQRAHCLDRFGRLLPHVDEALEKHLGQTGTFYAHQWRPGDTLIVDNFSVCHRHAPADPVPAGAMQRTSVAGPAVWWRSQKDWRPRVALILPPPADIR